MKNGILSKVTGQPRTLPKNGMSRSLGSERLLIMKKPSQHLIAEVPRSAAKVGMTIGIDLGDVWSHYCTLNEYGEVVNRGRFRTTPFGSREVVYRSTSSADRDGGGNPLDLGQRTAPGDGPRGNRGERQGSAGDLAQQPEERYGGCGEDRPLRPGGSRDTASDLASHGCPTGSSHLDPCPQPYRSAADGGCELGTRTGEALRVPASSFVHPVFRQAVHGRAAAKSGSGAWSGSRADRCDDGEDPAVRPHHQATHRDGVSGDAGADPGLWRRPTHSTDLRSDAGQQGTLPAQPGCGLLSRPATETQPVRRPRPATRHHQGWQRLPAYSAGRVRQPCPRTAWKRLDVTSVGAASGLARRQAVPQSGHRRRCSQAGSPASSHLGHAGTIHPVLCSSCLRTRTMFIVAKPRVPVTACRVGPL